MQCLEQHIRREVGGKSERQAKLYRSEGWEEMEKIKSGADKDRAILLAEAERQAEVLRGQGDAEAASVWAEAVNKSPEFFGFTRSLEAYQKSFARNSRIFLTPDNPFLKYMR